MYLYVVLGVYDLGYSVSYPDCPMCGLGMNLGVYWAEPGRLWRDALLLTLALLALRTLPLRLAGRRRRLVTLGPPGRRQVPVLGRWRVGPPAAAGGGVGVATSGPLISSSGSPPVWWPPLRLVWRGRPPIMVVIFLPVRGVRGFEIRTVRCALACWCCWCCCGYWCWCWCCCSRIFLALAV